MSTPRTDFEIVIQTERLARLLMMEFHGREPVLPGNLCRGAKDPRARECWNAACAIQELLTDTDPENAIAELASGTPELLANPKAGEESVISVEPAPGLKRLFDLQIGTRFRYAAHSSEQDRVYVLIDKGACGLIVDEPAPLTKERWIQGAYSAADSSVEFREMLVYEVEVQRKNP